MKSETRLIEQLLQDFGAAVQVPVERDIETVRARVRAEGFGFLTLRLPEFEKGLLVSLERGHVTRDDFPGFAPRSRRGWLPGFLQGFTSRIFSHVDGKILDDPDIECVGAIRQICGVLGKLKEQTSSEKESRALQQFIDTDAGLTDINAWLRSPDSADFRDNFSRIARLVWASPLSKLDEMVYYNELAPTHGPGATAERLTANGRWTISQWYERLEPEFPACYWAVPNWHFQDHLDNIEMLPPDCELPVRVITVPKTQKAPRIIAIEPSVVQYCQQAVLGELVPLLERSDYPFCGFEDQLPNRDMAQEGSFLGNLSTIDLSEASDRVCVELVQLLLSPYPHLLRAVMACRSTKAQVEGHGIVELQKFASMGSALCFPMEALCFSVLTLMGIEVAQGGRCLDSLDLERLRYQVRIYGDDIIVPSQTAQSVMEVLESAGLKVNRGKSFHNGKFRESCGGDYFNGRDVTIVRCRRRLPNSITQGEEIASLVAFRNLCYSAGHWRTVKWVDDYLERLIPLPVVTPTSPALGRHVVSGEYQVDSWHPDYQAPRVRAAKLTSKAPADELDDVGALMKFFLKRGNEPRESEHLIRYGRPRSARIKIGWHQPF